MYDFEEYTYHVLKIFRHQFDRGNDYAITRDKDPHPLCSFEDAAKSILKAANAVMEVWLSLLTCGSRGRIILLVSHTFRVLITDEGIAFKNFGRERIADALSVDKNFNVYICM